MRTINEASRLMRFTLHRLRAELTYFTLSQVVTWRICSARVRTACAHPTGLRLASLVAMLLMPVSLLAGNNDPVITLATGEGEGRCAVGYKIEIFKDGKVHWLGKYYVHVKGHRYKRIGKDKVNALLKRFDEAQFFEMPDYLAMQKDRQKAILAEIKATGVVPDDVDIAFKIVMDASVYRITLNTSGRKRTLAYQGKGGEEGMLEEAIMQAIQAEKWLFPAPDPWQSGCIEDH